MEVVKKKMMPSLFLCLIFRQSVFGFKTEKGNVSISHYKYSLWDPEVKLVH